MAEMILIIIKTIFQLSYQIVKPLQKSLGDGWVTFHY